jgi:hypothetical protein
MGCAQGAHAGLTSTSLWRRLLWNRPLRPERSCYEMKHFSGQTRSELAAKRLQSSSSSATDLWPIFALAKRYSARLALSSWRTLHEGVTELFRHLGWNLVIGGRSHFDGKRQVSIRNEQRVRSDPGRLKPSQTRSFRLPAWSKTRRNNQRSPSKKRHWRFISGRRMPRPLRLWPCSSAKDERNAFKRMADSFFCSSG